jgi:hypothetical protein
MAPPAAAGAPAATVPLTLAKVRSLWSNVRARAESERPSIAASLGRATIETVDDVEGITLRVPDNIAGEALKRSLAEVKRAVDGVFGRPVGVRVLVGTSSGANAGPDDGDPHGDHPDDVARYAFDRLL